MMTKDIYIPGEVFPWQNQRSFGVLRRRNKRECHSYVGRCDDRFSNWYFGLFGDSPTGGVGSAVNADELNARMAKLESRDAVRDDDRLMFFSKVLRSTGRHSRASKQIRGSPVFNGCCAFCGTNTVQITRAHIVPGAFGVDYSPFSHGYQTSLDVKFARNFLPLCGTEGRTGTCYDEFDKFRITLLYNPFDSSYSIYCLDAANSPKAYLHGTQINVDPNFPPYRRLLACAPKSVCWNMVAKWRTKEISCFRWLRFLIKANLLRQTKKMKKWASMRVAPTVRSVVCYTCQF